MLEEPRTADVTTPRSGYWWAMRLLVGAVTFLVVGNLLILASHLVLQRSTAKADAPDIPVKNFAVVDDRVWRGAAPSSAGYEALAANGVTTIIDLRAEEDIRVDEVRLRDLGLTRFHLPLRDGQAPTPALVEDFLSIVSKSDGRVYVHCGAGVGRTGTMAAAYLIKEDGISNVEALRRNLAVGPPSLEQLAFASNLRADQVRRPPAPVVALSRVLDAPRRMWVGVRNSYE